MVYYLFQENRKKDFVVEKIDRFTLVHPYTTHVCIKISHRICISHSSLLGDNIPPLQLKEVHFGAQPQ